jgi:glucose/arabinose dehydrogenase/cytochrome c2
MHDPMMPPAAGPRRARRSTLVHGSRAAAAAQPARHVSSRSGLRGTRLTSLRLTLALLLALVIAPAHAADPVTGKSVFRAQCALCHSAEHGDHGAAQGPDLHGLYGRHVAGDPAYEYTAALRASDLTWDAATLGRFLASPAAAVKGTAMGVAVPLTADRDNLIAYFQALKSGSPVPATPALEPPAPGGAPASSHGDEEWRRDMAGRVHKIDPAFGLAAPRPARAVVNVPKLIERPPDARPQLPPGFAINVFASGLDEPRSLLTAPNGDVLVALTRSGRILLLRPADDDTTAAAIQSFAQGLYLPTGLALYPPLNKHPKWLYVIDGNRVVRYAYEPGDMRARGIPEVVVPELTPQGGGAGFMRGLAFSDDGKRMFVSIGSQSNVAEGMPRKSAAEIAAWEAGHGPGSAWGQETGRAQVLAFPAEPRGGPPVVVATGLRDCVRLTIQPRTGTLWCTVAERDGLGENLVPDFSTRLAPGQIYGWPWYYLGNHPDPRLKDERPDLAGHITVPDVLYQAHSGVTDLIFYNATGGRGAFPKQYVGDGFAVLHGSVSRAVRAGHKVVRVRMQDSNVPTGEYEDFLVGFIADNGSAWGSPAALAVARDGALLVSDDGANLIYRISYKH